jgi:hypothetical protein
MKEKVGEDNYNKFAEHLNGMQDERIRNLYDKYGDKLEFEIDSISAFAKGNVVHLQQSSFDGNKIYHPLGIVYHEAMHCFDMLGLQKITGNKYYKTGKKIKYKIGRSRFEKDEMFENISALPKYKLKDTIRRDLWEYVNGKDLPMYEDIGRKPRKKAEKEAWEEKSSMIYRASKNNFAEFESKIKAKYDGKPSAIASLSDIYGASGFSLSVKPFGSGHERGYFKDAGFAEQEFFAEVADAIATNKESYDLLSEIFPNAMKVWENIVDDVLKAGD